MEKMFRPNRWFILFCALFLVVCGSYQLVGNLRLEETAKQAAADIFTWEWPVKHLKSQATITEISIVKKSDTDGIVKVKGQQTLMRRSDNSHESVECNAVLTFYKKSGEWILSKVEFE